MLSDRCLSVCLSVCLSCPVCDVGVLWQTVGWIEMKLCTQVGLDSGHTVINGDPAPLPKRNTASQFSAHICCGEMDGRIKMPLGMEVGLDPGDFVLDGDPAPLPQKGAEPPIFRPMFIVAKRLDGSRWYGHGGRPQPRRLCVRWAPSPSPSFWPIPIVAKWLDASRCHLVQR